MRTPILRYLPASGDVRPGDVLAGKYRVERVIGRGGMGLVIAATHVHLGERVAIKLLLPGSPVTPDAFARFLREGQAAARMRSEHVARVHDAGVLDSGEPYLVLEFLDGVDLRSLLRARGRLPIDTAVVYVLQVCEALAEAHALGIVHRDLKPANLFLTRRADGSSIVKVIDFGISKIASPADADSSMSSLTAHDAAIGTPNYMAPEQMRSARAADARADIWSLGAVLHGLLTGASPFAGETLIEVYDRILKGPPSLRAAREDAPPALEAVVHRCLRLDPAERYQSVAELAAALAELAPPEGRVSAERAIRIAERPETASLPLPDGPFGSADTALPLASTELAPGHTPSDATASIDVSFEVERPTTQAERDPSWAGRAKVEVPAPPAALRPSAEAGPPASAARGGPDRRSRRPVLVAVASASAVALAASALALWGPRQSSLPSFEEHAENTVPARAAHAASSEQQTAAPAMSPALAASVALPSPASAPAKVASSAADATAPATPVKQPLSHRQAPSPRPPSTSVTVAHATPVSSPPATATAVATPATAAAAAAHAHASAAPVERPVVRNVPGLSDTPD